MDEKTEVQTQEEPVLARIVNPAGREKMVPLDYPVEFRGIVYEEIRVKRVTGREVADYFELMGQGAAKMPPTVDCPVEVWDALDADDQHKVDGFAIDFFPQVVRALLASFQADGATTSASSPVSSTPASTS